MLHNCQFANEMPSSGRSDRHDDRGCLVLFLVRLYSLANFQLLNLTSLFSLFLFSLFYFPFVTLADVEKI
jgi:hypothetical protein